MSGLGLELYDTFLSGVLSSGNPDSVISQIDRCERVVFGRDLCQNVT